MAAMASGSTSVKTDTVYLFIDGGYLRPTFQNALTAFYGNLDSLLPQLNFDRLRTSCSADRAFYYDCLPDTSRENSSGQLTAEILASIKRTRGYHARIGALVGQGNRLRQKEVDIGLAVDMLTHSFAGNMTHAVLLAGDRDFKPLVDALVGLGTYVTLLCEEKSASNVLMDTVDEVRLATLSTWYSSTTESFKGLHPMPQGSIVQSDVLDIPGDSALAAQGAFGKKTVLILKIREGEYLLQVNEFDSHDRVLRIGWHNLDELKRYFELQFCCNIAWE